MVFPRAVVSGVMVEVEAHIALGNYTTDEGKRMNIYQKIVPTGTPGIRTATSKLKKAGYRVNTSSLGPQVTDDGLIKSTMINVYFDDSHDAIDQIRAKNIIQNNLEDAKGAINGHMARL